MRSSNGPRKWIGGGRGPRIYVMPRDGRWMFISDAGTEKGEGIELIERGQQRVDGERGVAAAEGWRCSRMGSRVKERRVAG